MARRKTHETSETTNSAITDDRQQSATSTPGTEDMSVRHFFHRMRTVGQLIHKGFGLDKVQDADVVTKNAYLVVVSRIIEALSREEELTTAELATLSKTLAEQRRLQIADKEIERKFTKEDATPPTPREVSGAIASLYGTTEDACTHRDSGCTNSPQSIGINNSPPS